MASDHSNDAQDVADIESQAWDKATNVGIDPDQDPELQEYLLKATDVERAEKAIERLKGLLH